SLYTTPSPTPTYPLSLHDALPIYPGRAQAVAQGDEDPLRRPFQQLEVELLQPRPEPDRPLGRPDLGRDDDRLPRYHAGGAGPAKDRKSTRLNSSHVAISYAVFCLK